MKKYIQHFVLVAALAAVGKTSFANPQSGNVVAGTASISQTGNTTTINQSSKNAIINWQSFNIGASESTHFQQPAGGAALNRINPANGVSQIYGRLTATGMIILVNPAGVYFGPKAYVNVGGMIASTAQISDQDFLNGYYHFVNSSQYNGAIVNAGQIIAAKHGLIALIGGAVRNDGLIEANIGRVVLASGNAFTMSFAGNDLISFSVDASLTSRAQDNNGRKLADGVKNTGKIIANGGKILVTVDAAAGVLDHAINMQGLTQAKSVRVSHGEIIFSATPSSGVIRIAGSVNASGRQHGRSGGNVTITGNNILLDSSAVINVSGDAGAGNVNIGGNYQGIGPLLHASSVSMMPGAKILANAVTRGNGGNVILWSDLYTTVSGSIDVSGGSLSGNGGLIETSSHGVLTIGALNVNTSALHGQSGTWLLDPSDLTIAAASDSNVTGTSPFTPSTQAANSVLNITTLIAALNSGNVIIQTSAGAGPGNGDIFITTPVTWASGNSLLLSAYRNITATASIANSGGANVTLRADNTGTGVGTVSFSAGNQVSVTGSGIVAIYYNPAVFGTQDTIYTGGTAAQQYMLVNTAANLQNINSYLNGNFALGTNLILTGNFTPIGSAATPYTGNFDGQNFTINNLSITNVTPNTDLGLFGAIASSASLKNVKLNNVTIVQTADNAGTSIYIGSLVGLNNGGVIFNASVTHPVITATGTNYGMTGSRGYYDIGGLVGATFGGTITQSYSSGGSITNQVTTNANAANLSAFNEVGGFLGGEHSSAALDTDYSTTAVTSTGNVTVSGAGATGELLVGGFLGRLDQTSTAYNIDSTAPVSVTSTLSVPSASGAGYVLVGGLIGITSIANSPSTTPPPVVTNAYSTSAVTLHGTFTNSAPGSAEFLAGGLMGQTNGVLTNSHSTGAVIATLASDLTSSNESFYVGGLAGANFTIIDNSYSSSPVTVTGNSVGNDVEVGGFVGSNITLFDKEITGSSASGLVNVAVNNTNGGQLYIGGLAGSNIYYGNPPPARLPFNNDYSISILNVSGQNDASTTVIGGLVGGNGKDPADPGGNIINSYSTGFINNNVTTLNGGTTTAGGFIGSSIPSSDPLAEPITLANNFYDTGTTGYNQNQGVGNQPGAVTGVTPGCFNGGACPNGGSANLSSQATYNTAGWNFITTWGIINNASYPYLLGANPLPPQVISGATPVAGGTSVNLVTNGTIIDTTLTGPNGFFYFFEPNGTIASNALGLVYLTGSPTRGNSIFAPAPDGNSSGVAIAANTIQVGSASTLSIANSDLAALINGLADVNLLYSGTGSAITIGTNSNPTVNLFTTPTTTYQLSGSMMNIAGGNGNLTFNGPVTVTGTASISSHLVDFANTLSGNTNALGITTTGSTTFANTVSLGSLTVTASAININTASITTLGAQLYNSPVMLGGDVTLTAGNLTFDNGISGGSNLTINGQATDNNIVFNGPISLHNISVFANSGGNNTLSVNSGNPEIWTLTATNTGNITGITGVTGVFDFVNLPNLTGGTLGNTFIFNNGTTISGTINGTNLAASNTVDVSGYTSIFNAIMSNNIFNGQVINNSLATIVSYLNIGSIIGNDISTLTLPNKVNVLTLTAFNAGFISDPFYFSRFDHFTSQSGSDSVNFIAPGIYNLQTTQTTVGGQVIGLNGFNYDLFTGNITLTGGNSPPVPPTPNTPSANIYVAAIMLGGTPNGTNKILLPSDILLGENTVNDIVEMFQGNSPCDDARGKLNINAVDIDLRRQFCNLSSL